MKISRYDIRKLQGENWLNDKIIDCYMNLVCHRSKEEMVNAKEPTMYAITTYFFEKIKKDGISSVNKWFKKINIFDYDLVILPVNVENSHWGLAVSQNFFKKFSMYLMIFL